MDARDRILAATLEVFAEHGTRGATTRRIAEAAGVNEVTLFRHFGSKEKLLQEALVCVSERAPAPVLPEMPQAPVRELTEWSARQLEHLYQMRALIRTGMGEFEERPEVGSRACQGPVRVANELNGYLTRLREEGLVTEPLDTRAAAALLMGALFADAMGRDMMPERYPYPLNAAAARYVELFARAIGLRQKPPPAGEGWSMGGGNRGERDHVDF